MENKGLSIESARHRADRVYPGLKRLTNTERILANKKRNTLLQSLSNGVSYSCAQNKIHIGKLSPGCLICSRGYWSCLFINTLCTRRCFYCPQDRKINQEHAPAEAADIIFDSPQEYLAYLQKFNFKGVGFSGGEAFLVFEKLLTYIKKIFYKKRARSSPKRAGQSSDAQLAKIIC
ncbi:hypothetical protein ACFL2I_04575 [Candidatus Omnitrophota bacterium]